MSFSPIMTESYQPSLPSQTDTLTAFDGVSLDLQVGSVVKVDSPGETVFVSRVGCRAAVQFGDPLPVEDLSCFSDGRFRRLHTPIIPPASHPLLPR
jgi:hypothetical protein